MPTFDTPEPITATIEVGIGEVRIDAADRTATVVDVQPSDPAKDDDVKAAEQTRVDYGDGRLLVRAPKQRSWRPWSDGGSIEVTIELPAGSAVIAVGQVADFGCDGRLGDCRIKTGIGHIRVDHADTPTLKSGVGDISVNRATGHTEATTGTGEVRLGDLDGSAEVKNSNGGTWVRAAGGDLRVKAANGSIAVDRSRAGVDAKSANGDVRLGEVGRGSVVLQTHAGDVEIGIPEGTAAWLDVRAVAGTVHNALQAADDPGPSAETVEVSARTTLGDVVIRRP